MARKASEKDEHGFCTCRPEFRVRRTPRDTLEEAVANTVETVELHLRTLPPDEPELLLSRQVLITVIELNLWSPA